LSRRALNRATLARQLLLARSPITPLEAVARLVGLQAQIPHNPYLALWSRLDQFDPAELSQLLLDRKVVRIVVMRATIHLVTADDCIVLRPLAQPVLAGELARHPEYAPALKDVDLGPVLDFARGLLAQHPRTGGQLRAAMAGQFPERNPAALAYACRNFLALVQVPPRGVWGRSAQVCSTTAEAWLGRPLASDPSIDEVVLRYFAAFGPATVADVSTWSRLSRLREVADRLRPQLRTFRDEEGRELFDLPDAPRPDPDVEAPPRFLPEYDNLLLSHADRSRFAPEATRKQLATTSGPVHGAVLSGGELVGAWSRAKGTLTIRPVAPLTPKARDDLAAEGEAAVRFLDDAAGTVEVRIAEPR
jgi:hypothetical protein